MDGSAESNETKVCTRGKGGGRRGWKGEGDDSVHGAWVWWNRVENKSVQFPGDTLSVSGRHPRFSLSFLVVGERERERGKFLLPKWRDFEYLADKNEFHWDILLFGF